MRREDSQKRKKTYNTSEQIILFQNYGYDFYLLNEVKNLMLSITETIHKTTLWEGVFKKQHYKSHFAWVLGQMEEIYQKTFNKPTKDTLYKFFELSYYNRDNREFAYNLIKTSYLELFNADFEKNEEQIKTLVEDYKMMVQFLTSKK